MAGLFDNIFGAPGGMYADMLSPEQQAAIRKQSMLQMAAKLLEGSGPSPVRRTLGQNLGSALGAGAEAVQSGQTNAVQQMLLKQKLDEAKMQKDQAARIAEIFGASQPAPTPLTGVDAINAPAGGAVGPTINRAAAIGTMPAGPSKADIAARYRQAANVSASDPAKAKAYMDIANQLDPRPEVTGQPFEATDMAGNPIMVQQMKDGTTRTMEGFGPKRDVVLQNLGGRMVAIDKNKLKGNESFAMTMTPGEIASNQVARGNLGVAQSNLSLAQQRYARENFDLVDTDQGQMYVSKVPGQAAIPAVGPTGATLKSASSNKPTDGQSNAAGFAQRMELATSIIDSLPAGSQAGVGTRTAEVVPLFGGALSRVIQSPETQKYEQAAQDWVRAKLRKESGAVIGEQEARDEYATYFPMVGDTPEKITQKAEARRVATLAMKKAAGPAYEPYVPPSPRPAAPPPARLGTGTFNVTVDY